MPALGYALLPVTRWTVALTWAWSAWMKPPGSWGFLPDALEISRLHSGIPAWPGIADALAANIDVFGWLILLLELYLALTLAAGFLTRLNGFIATGYAAIIVLLAWNIPKTGEGIPESFPVPIGGWLWLLLPLLILPLTAALSRSGRLWGIDARLHKAWQDTDAPAKRWLVEHAL